MTLNEWPSITEILADFLSPFEMEKFRGCRVADIGAGTGRHVEGLLQAGAREVIAVEPSKAIEVIKRRYGDGHDGKGAHSQAGKAVPASYRPQPWRDLGFSTSRRPTGADYRGGTGDLGNGAVKGQDHGTNHGRMRVGDGSGHNVRGASVAGGAGF